MDKKYVNAVLTATVVLALAGCVAGHTLKIPNLDMPSIDPAGAPNFAAELRQCVAQPAGVCRQIEPQTTVVEKLHEIAQAAETALKDESKTILLCTAAGNGQQSVTLDKDSRSTLESVKLADGLLAPIMQHATDSGSPMPELKASELGKLHSALRDSLRNDGWRKTSEKLAHAPANCKAAEDLHRVASYVQAYFHAYFKDGQFVQLELSKDDLRAKLIKQIKEETGAKDADVSRLADQILKDTPKSIPIFGKLDDSDGFVTRGGSTYKAPLITAELTPFSKKKLTVSKIDTTALVADLTRVFIEAVFDAIQELPAVSTATAVTSAKEYPLLATRVNDPKNAIEVDTGGGRSSRNLCSANFSNVETWATRTEGVTDVGVGMLIRGGGVFALNNERAAALVETAIGVTARKISEKIAWCYYACAQVHTDDAQTKDDCKNADTAKSAAAPVPQQSSAANLTVDKVE